MSQRRDNVRVGALLLGLLAMTYTLLALLLAALLNGCASGPPAAPTAPPPTVAQEQAAAEAIARRWSWPAEKGVRVLVDPDLNASRPGILGLWQLDKKLVTVVGRDCTPSGCKGFYPLNLEGQTLHELHHAKLDLVATAEERKRNQQEWYAALYHGAPSPSQYALTNAHEFFAERGRVRYQGRPLTASPSRGPPQMAPCRGPGASGTLSRRGP